MILEVTNAIETLKIVGMIVGIVGGVGGPVGALWYMKGQLDSTKERLIALEVAQREDIAKEKEIIKHLGTLAAVSDRLEAYENDLAERRGNDSSIANNLATLAANLNNNSAMEKNTISIRKINNGMILNGKKVICCSILLLLILYGFSRCMLRL